MFFIGKSSTAISPKRRTRLVVAMTLVAVADALPVLVVRQNRLVCASDVRVLASRQPTLLLASCLFGLRLRSTRSPLDNASLSDTPMLCQQRHRSWAMSLFRPRMSS